jgi:hypothetical protein
MPALGAYAGSFSFWRVSRLQSAAASSHLLVADAVRPAQWRAELHADRHGISVLWLMTDWSVTKRCRFLKRRVCGLDAELRDSPLFVNGGGRTTRAGAERAHRRRAA